MIFGIGTDIVQVSRIQADLERYGDKFALRILTTKELQEYRTNTNQANFLARRFAAKEAAVKALGTGFSHGLQLHNITVTHDHYGKPGLEFSGAALDYVHEHNISVAHLSLADERDYAVAFVTLERA
jgi:holo-[acyl-carrier protein] synthase